MNKFTLVSLSLFLSFLHTLGQPKKTTNLNTAKPTAITKKIDLLFSTFAKRNSAGYAIGVVKDQQTIYARGYGSANLDYELPNNATTAFDIASVSKQFTAACIALLIIEGKLTLESPVLQYVPELSKYRDTIRVKHLIYNTSGITDYMKLPRANGKSWITFNYFTIDESIRVSLKADTLAFKPGSKWDYCNTNFMLLTRIVEKISGETFAAFAQKHLFGPLGMKHTFINDDNTQIITNRATPYNYRSKEIVDAYRKEGIAVGYGEGWIQHPRNSPNYGGSGVSTNVTDLLIWSKNFFSKKFGGEAFYSLMHNTPVFPHGRNNQAFGLYFGTYKGKQYVAWDGGDFGVSSQLIRFPKEKIAIAVLSNIGTGNAAEKATQVADILIAANLL